MIHPLAVDHLQKDNALQLTKLFFFRELRFLCLIQLDCLLLELLLELVLAANLLQCLLSHRLKRNGRKQYGIKLICIPVLFV